MLFGFGWAAIFFALGFFALGFSVGGIWVMADIPWSGTHHLITNLCRWCRHRKH
jgi:hypothetical protein